MTDFVLGISAFYHDSAAALVADGVPVAAAQEERFSRIRNDSTFPAQAAGYCLRQAGITLSDVSVVAYYEDPKIKFRRVVSTFLESAPHGYPAFRDTFPQWLSWKRKATEKVRRELSVLGSVPQIDVRRHHESHAA
jgi:carbamoyltransferase